MNQTIIFLGVLAIVAFIGWPVCYYVGRHRGRTKAKAHDAGGRQRGLGPLDNGVELQAPRRSGAYEAVEARSLVGDDEEDVFTMT